MGEGRGGLVGRATVTCFFLAGGRQPAVPGSAELLASLGFLIKRETLHPSLLLFFCGNHMVCCAFRGAVFCAHHCAVRGPAFVLMIALFGVLLFVLMIVLFGVLCFVLMIVLFGVLLFVLMIALFGVLMIVLFGVPLFVLMIVLCLGGKLF